MRQATDVFGEWAEKGRDIGMAKGHAVSVSEMLSFISEERKELDKQFSFLDLGCGNGWVVRDALKNSLCNRAVGIDGAKQMIGNAKSYGGDGEYILADIDSYDSYEKFDVIHSMEVLYYLKNPKDIIKKIVDTWLNKGGRFIAGIDLYYENENSHSWEEKVGTRMLMLKEAEWLQIFEDAGLSKVKSWRSNKSLDWAGTLVLTGNK